MKKMKRILALTLALVLAMAMMTGCGKKDDATNASPSPEATDAAPADSTEPEAEPTDDAAAADREIKPCTIRLNTMMAGTDTGTPVLEEVLEQFQKDFPDVKIENESVVATDETKATFVSSFTMDNEPDVFQWYSEAQSNPIVKMDKWVTVEEMQAYEPEIGKDTTEAAWAACKSPLDGKNYVVPTTGFVECLFVNAKIFKDNNLELPTDWDKFTKAIETLSKTDIIPLTASLNVEPHYLIENLMLAMSGFDIYSTLPETVPQEWVDAVNLVKDLRDMGAFPKDADAIDEAAAKQYFFDGKAAMLCEGSWIGGGIPEDMQADVEVMVMPTPPNGKATPTDGIAGYTSGFGISRKAWNDPDKREACVQLLLALSNKETVTKLWKIQGAAACAVETTEEDAAESSVIGQKLIALGKTFTKSTPPTDARTGAEPWTTFVSNIVAISKGEGDAQQAFQTMLDQYKENNQ